jgi:UDP-N-acetylglucosamine 1-carboxyvinyltransferase
MVVQGGGRLNGVTAASGSKNSALPLIFASLLADGEHVFHNVPDLIDVKSAAALLQNLGCEVAYADHTLRVFVKPLKTVEASYDIVRPL